MFQISNKMNPEKSSDKSQDNTTPNKTDGGGKRYNTGKNRMDLAPGFAQEQYTRVLTMGAEK